MYISDDGCGDPRAKAKYKWTALYIAVSVFLFVFSRVYYLYSHNVHSPYMTFAFAVALVLGAFPCFVTSFLKLKPDGAYIPVRLYHSGAAAVTVGCVLRGVFDIAGTSSVYQGYIMWTGLVMLVLGTVGYIAAVSGGGIKK
ncbi:MAG: hypothetical protein LUH54_00030 [Firmicutes bacterium]|nr:hypothetical protein [Bacillota bacterium]